LIRHVELWKWGKSCYHFSIIVEPIIITIQ
jgi:hypothetical protein